MAAGNFERCHAVTAKWEGGWSNHPDDPGGATNYGVTQALYDHWRVRAGKPKQSVKYITKTEAIRIYIDEFWIPVGAEKLAAGVDLATYDAGVNSGNSRARKWLKASIGGPDEQTVKNICRKRLGFMQSLRIWKTFGKGWSRRVADIEAKGVAWALAAKANSNVTKKSLEREAEKAHKTAGKQVGTGGAVGGGGAVSSPEMADQVAGWVLGGILLAAFAVAAILVIRAIVNKHRAQAYAAEAAKL